MKFTKATQAKSHGDAIQFNMDIAGVPRQFEISGDVLRERFGAVDDTPAALLHAFEDGAEALIEAARRARSIPSEGVIPLGEGDFEQGPEDA